MEIENYQPSKQVPTKPEEKKVEKVVSGTVKTRKRGFLASSGIADGANNVRNYAIHDVLVPAFLKAVEDVVSNGIHMFLYGEPNYGKRSSGASRVSYRQFYDRGNDRDRYEPRYRSTGYDYEDLVFESRGEAELILDNMYDILERYRVVTVADLYDLAGEPGRHTDNKYGWTDISNASVARIRDGYVIKLPRALPVD